MSKTLTEQWKDGELPEDTYYVQFLCGRYGTYQFEQFKGFGFDNDLAYIKEVLAPVPSYVEYLVLSEYKKLEKDAIQNLINEHIADASKTIERLKEQLAIATKALEDIGFSLWDEMDCRYCAKKALKAIKKWGVK